MIQALKSFGGIDIEAALFTYEEREEILATVDDRELWCKLALHTTTDGHTVAVSKNTYLDDGLEVDSSILEKIILIKRSEHPRVLSF